MLAVFPIFGGTSPYVAMLPLLAILLITAVKDGIEDYRRQQLDDGVNNSAVTRLGDWRNVNVSTVQRGFFARLFGLKASSSSLSSSSSSSNKSMTRNKKVSKGVRKLREKEGDLNMDFLYEGGSKLMQSSTDLGHDNMADNTLVEYDSRDSNSSSTYKQIRDKSSSINMSRDRSGSTAARSMATSNRSNRSNKKGVVDYDRKVSGTAKWERTLWKKLEVGDVVLLRENDQVPADIVVLSTSDADGQCFIETKNVSTPS